MCAEFPPLSLYIHIPWCVQKCPYCDFNSHTLKTPIADVDYVHHLLTDFEQDLTLTAGRPIRTLFIGGGTPSLFSAQAIQRLLDGVRARVTLAPQAEITLEANPGTVETTRFHHFYQSGVNRLSIGVQSFHLEKLQRLGRIHGPEEAINAALLAQTLPLTSFNLDLMHGLPEQTLRQALADLQQAMALDPPHLSWYQLTLEPNTLFAAKPPTLPDEETLWMIYTQGDELLRAAGYQRYEISAYAQPGHQCQHNLNYWRFGDYLGIGCGAHGKLTQRDGSIIRTVKTRHPSGYMRGDYLQKRFVVADEDKPFDYFVNRFRLAEATPRAEFTHLTGLSEQRIRPAIDQALAQGYLTETAASWQVTDQGKLFLNTLLELFLP